MKNKKLLFRSLFAAGSSLLAISSASAQTGTWGGTAVPAAGVTSSNWTDALMWSGGTIANLADNTANFTGINITGNKTVNLNGDRTIGNITFTDLTTASNDLLISGNTLTLDVTSGAPQINVTNRNLTISSIIAGIDGLTKIGAGNLTLSGPNTYSGTTTLSGGITFANNNSAFGTSAVTFSDPGIDSLLQLGSGISLANNITIGSNNGIAATGLIRVANGQSATLTGTITITSNANSGGHFGGTAFDGTGTLNITGPINSTVTVSHRSATLVLGGGGSYSNISIGEGTVRLSANNGIATNATAILGTVGNATATLDLAGFNQSLVGINKLTQPAPDSAARIGNSLTASNSTLTTTGTSSYSGTIVNNFGSGTGKVALTVNGGSLTLSGANTYSGDTTISSSGTLTISGAGSINNTARINVNTSTTLDVDGITGLTFTVGSAQTLTGGGTILATGKNVLANGTLSPGSSPGTLTQDGGTLQLGVGGDYNWQIHDATGAAGIGYDTTKLINGASLDLSLLSAGNTYNINLWSLSSIGPDVNGNATNFNNAVSQSWTLFSTGSAISAFSTDKFTINTGAFNGTDGFDNALDGGAFSVGLGDSNTDLVLKFTAVPEPGAALLGGLGLLALLRRRRD